MGKTKILKCDKRLNGGCQLSADSCKYLVQVSHSSLFLLTNYLCLSHVMTSISAVV